MSDKPKIALITAASLGMVLTQSSAPRAETEDNSTPEKITKIAGDLDEDVLYSTLSDDALEKAAGFCRVIQMTCAAGGVCYNLPPPKKQPYVKNRK
jgi:hypothetical protein